MTRDTNQPETVLVIDPDRVHGQTVANGITDAGFLACVRDDASDVGSVLHTESLALVLCSVEDNGRNGSTLLKEIRALRPDVPVVLMAEQISVRQVVRAMHAGAADFLIKPLSRDILAERLATIVGGTALKDCDPIAESPVMRATLSLARRVADSEATILLTGESGTGKEVFARYIHRHSRRMRGPFVAINCAAIPEQLLESTLFGHEKGAYTGARETRPGKFEAAHGGTLLLDEVSEMPLTLQAKLLRVLQERELERLGGSRTIRLDVRVLATSNRDLSVCVADGDFRQDLFFRLNVFPIQLPPLRERAEDILPLAHRFLRAHAAPDDQVRLSDDSGDLLRRYTWPGNVRELDNVIQRALILTSGGPIGVDDLRIGETPRATTVGPDTSAPDSVCGDGLLERDLWMRERELILAALTGENGSRKDAAQRLGISPRTLRYKLARMREEGVVPPEGSA